MAGPSHLKGSSTASLGRTWFTWAHTISPR